MKKLFCVSGFLSTPSTWEFLNKFNFVVCPHSPEDFIKKKLSEVFTAEGADVLVGYSLGGRLCLRALADGSCRPLAAIIISANPGLTSDDERRRRLATDQEWANDFRTEPWEELLAAWDRQTVFGGRICRYDRFEKDFDRESLAQILDGFSLGRQPDLRSQLEKLEIPILFIAGEDDGRYSRLAKEMTRINPKFKHWIAPNSGHRVPWEVDEKILVSEMKKFLEELE